MSLSLDTPLTASDIRSLLTNCDEVTFRTRLSILEREVRFRLEHPSSGDRDWFPKVIDALGCGQCPWAMDMRVELLLLTIQWHYAQRCSLQGIQIAERALDLALRADAPILQRRALNHLAILHIDNVNICDATIYLVEALSIAERLGDRVGKCATLANLATARFEAGLLDESAKLGLYVVELAGSDPLLQQLKADAHHNIALASLILDDLPTARAHMEHAIHALVEPTTQFLVDQRVIMELTFIKILVRTGDIQGARRRLQISQAFAQSKESKLTHVHSTLATAICDAAEGHADIALTRLGHLESEVLPTEPAFRDVLEIELYCNRLAGRERFTRYYSERYLSNLAEWQRRTAIQQVNALKRTLGGTDFLPDRDFLSLPEEIRNRLVFLSAGRESRGFQQHLETLSILSEMREDATGEHSLRVGRLAALLAIELGYSKRDADTLEIATRVHDIGKMAVPDAVLLKRGKLTVAETLVIRRHSTEGCQILSELLREVERTRSKLNCESLRLAAEIALHHHEWWDGSGYPRRIAGDRIPEAARIVALADAFDELTHHRPYKRPDSVETALRKIFELRGKQFEPRLCDEFLRVAKRLVVDRSLEVYEAFRPEERSHPFAAANRVIRRIVQSIKVIPTST